jgi:carbon storage regulator
MLILTRKTDESIIIGNNVEVKILKLQGNQVHIGISAPREVSIYRKEIYEQIKNENASAVQSSIDDSSIKNLESNLSSIRELISGK